MASSFSETKQTYLVPYPRRSAQEKDFFEGLANQIFEGTVEFTWEDLIQKYPDHLDQIFDAMLGDEMTQKQLDELITAGFDINRPSDTYDIPGDIIEPITPLELSIRGGIPYLFSLLVANGADVESHSLYGLTPLEMLLDEYSQLGSEYTNTEFEELLAAGAKPEVRSLGVVLEAVEDILRKHSLGESPIVDFAYRVAKKYPKEYHQILDKIASEEEEINAFYEEEFYQRKREGRSYPGESSFYQPRRWDRRQRQDFLQWQHRQQRYPHPPSATLIRGVLSGAVPSKLLGANRF